MAEQNKVIRPKSRASALSEIQADSQMIKQAKTNIETLKMLLNWVKHPINNFETNGQMDQRTN